ncbi:tail fiber domain-containing protein [Lacinutrix mariniflava]|uniref:tail fiber domain-containing protein n=1 Tax=Lacinutrix mariniflava TaxID=342955 RepID=UPI001379289D
MDNSSEKRCKNTIEDSNLDLIIRLQFVSYFRNNDENNKLECGFITQELKETQKKVVQKKMGLLLRIPPNAC